MKPPSLAIVVPTYNERENIRELVRRLDQTLVGTSWEVIFVDDDSADGTRDEVWELSFEDPRVRCICRVGRKGLSSACIEGMASTQAEYLLVMDADLQHDEAIIPQMLAAVRDEGYDLAVGSRYIEGGGISKEWSTSRRLISRLATVAAQKVTHHSISDPMSGYFLLKRSVFWRVVHRLSGRGFKILLDIIASSKQSLRIKEVPFQFRLRRAGESKLTGNVAADYVLLLLDKTVGRLIPIRFIMFVLAGSVGALLHLGILGGMHKTLHEDFWLSQAVATLSAMVLNFVLNNYFTYRDRRLQGIQFMVGLLLFMAICSVGALTNVQLAQYLYRHALPWWLAGLLGAVIGSVWNYGVSTQMVWSRHQRVATNQRQ